MKGNVYGPNKTSYNRAVAFLLLSPPLQPLIGIIETSVGVILTLSP